MSFRQTFTDDTFGSTDPTFRKEVGEYLTRSEQEARRKTFETRAKALIELRFKQDTNVTLALRDKYRKPIFGLVYLYDVLPSLAECVDETDTELYCVSQLVHCLQTAAAMEADGITDETLILTAMLHDLGKLTSLVGEAPEYVNGPNQPLGENAPGCGLDNAIIMWNHDEFAYERVKDHVPDHVAWLVRYHSLRFDCAEDLMDERDRAYFAKYLETFRKYDLGSKSTFDLPRKGLADYKGLIEKYFPNKILI